MFAKQVLVLVALGVLCLFFSRAQEIPETKTIDTVVNGKHIVVPFFEPGVDSVAAEQKQVDLNAWHGIQKILLSALHKITVERKSIVSLYSYPNSLLVVLSEKKSSTARLVKEGKALKKKEGTTKDSMAIYSDMKEFSKQQSLARKDKEVDVIDKGEAAENFMHRFNDFLDMFDEILTMSPVGSYLKWRSMTIDGVPIAHEAAYFYDYLKNNGFGKTLWLADKAIATLEKVGGL